MSHQVDHPGPDILKAFLDRHGITMEACAEALGTTRITLYNWFNRITAPLPEMRRDIATWTKEEVPEASWPPVKDRRKNPKGEVAPFEPASGDEGSGEHPAIAPPKTGSDPE